jgi:hypothetical protein
MTCAGCADDKKPTPGALPWIVIGLVLVLIFWRKKLFSDLGPAGVFGVGRG